MKLIELLLSEMNIETSSRNVVQKDEALVSNLKGLWDNPEELPDHNVRAFKFTDKSKNAPVFEKDHTLSEVKAIIAKAGYVPFVEINRRTGEPVRRSSLIEKLNEFLKNGGKVQDQGMLGKMKSFFGN